MSKEHLQPNRVAPTLFVGVGGIGSKIVKKVAERSIMGQWVLIMFQPLASLSGTR